MPDDSQLWCEDCQIGYEGDCVHHGPLTQVRDTEVDTRARRSVPSILQLRDQQDFTGVYAKEKLAKRLQFGPLLAVKVLEGSKKASEAKEYISSRGGLLLWVTENGGTKCLLDTRQEERTNWMCFVRAAQNKGQQNVVAFQYRGQIYFVTIKEIAAECELRVWYSKDYAERMGRVLLPEERLSWQFRTRERFHCSGCSVVFSSSSALANHNCSKSGSDGGNKPSTSKQATLFETLSREEPSLTSREEGTSHHLTQKYRSRAVRKRREKRKLSSSIVGLVGSERSTKRRSNESIVIPAVEESRVGTSPFVEFVKKNRETRSPSEIVVEKSEGIKIEKSTATRESELSDIRAQVLQSVHSLSSSDVSFGALQASEGTGVPLASVLSSEESALSPIQKKEDSDSDQASESDKTAVGKRTVAKSEEESKLCSVCGESGPHTCTGRVFSCEQCQKSFSSRFKLSRHQLIHGGERQYSCHICHRSFRRKDHLQNHFQIHAPHKQYKCERPGCGKEYNSFMSFKKHRAFHSAEEGDLQCKFCFKMFDNKEDLINHLKEHVGTRSVKSPSERKFQCDQCDRKFFTRKDVKRHMVVHTGTRDFCCSLCPQKFGRKDHLVRHIKKSHGVTDMSKLETLADPLSQPGPSGMCSFGPPLSPTLSSISTSSGEAPPNYPPFLLVSSPVPPASPPVQSSISSYQDVSQFSGFSGDSGDIMLGPEPIKEEPELTASVTEFSSDISNILGLYLPPTDNISLGILDQPVTFTTSHQLLSSSSIQPPYSDPPQYEALSPVDFVPPHTSPHQLQLQEAEEEETDPPTVVSSSQSLPGFDQAFP